MLAAEIVDRIVPLFKLRPDILDLSLNPGTIYEIKPYIEVGSALAQIDLYRRVLMFRYPGRTFWGGLWSPDKNPYFISCVPGRS